MTTTGIVSATPGGVHASADAAGDCQGREATGAACPATITTTQATAETWGEMVQAGAVMTPTPATITTSTRSFEMRPYRPSCDVRGCLELGGWIIGSRGFRKLGDEKAIGLFCAEHGMERIAALDPNRFAGGAA